MSVIKKGRIFANGEQLTAEKLNVLVDEAEFNSSTAVDNSTTRVSNGAITVNPLGITNAQLASGAVTTLKIADDAIVTDKIADGAVTPAKLSTTGEFTVETMTATQGIKVKGPTDEVSLFSNNTFSSGIIFGGDSSGEGVAKLEYNRSDGKIYLYTGIDAGTTALIVDSGGNVLVGTTSKNPSSSYNSSSPNGTSLLGNKIECSRTGGVPFDFNRAETGTIGIFRRAGTLVGSIGVTGDATSYNTSSDYRLKEDIIEMDGSIDRLKALKPCNFRWKSDGTRVDGFIAHEAQEVVPEAVTGTKDAVDEEGNPDYQGIDQAKLVPLLTKALQEAVAKIESLEARVAALEL